MRVRLSLILLLSLTTVSMAASHPLFIKNNLPAGQQERGLTPEEEQEALALVKRFGERWRATNDFGQIIDELFVKDFSERLWQVPQDKLPWAFIDKTLVVHASPRELRRYYIAAGNFYGLYSGLYEAVESLREKSENNADSLEMAEVLSPEVVKILLSNRTFALLAELSKGEENNESAQENDSHQPAERADSAQAAPSAAEVNADDSADQSEVGIIKSLPQLNDASATLEKANGLMRQRLLKMPRKAQAASGKEEPESEQDSQKPNLSSLDEEEYGYPKDTPVIHLDSAPFCLYLIKIEGRFRILFVYIPVD